MMRRNEIDAMKLRLTGNGVQRIHKNFLHLSGEILLEYFRVLFNSSVDECPEVFDRKSSLICNG